MTTASDLAGLVKAAKERGCVLRTKLNARMEIEAVSFGLVPGGTYKRLGEPGAGWVPAVAAAERLRGILADG